jgi:hypothetical protein
MIEPGRGRLIVARGTQLLIFLLAVFIIDPELESVPTSTQCRVFSERWGLFRPLQRVAGAL